MNRSSLGLIALAAGIAALGFALGQYTQAQKPDRKTFPPKPPIPSYSVRAEFQVRDPIVPALIAAPPAPGSLAEALAETEPFRRAASLAVLLPLLGADSVAEVSTALDEETRALSGSDITLLLRFWAAHAPGEAIAWVREKCPLAYRGAAAVATIETWARTDARAASTMLQILTQLPAQDFSEAERALVRVWFETDQPGLEEYMRDLGASYARQRALRTFFLSAVARDGPHAAAQWAEAIPNEETKYKLDAFRQLGAVLTYKDPALGVHWCDAHCDGPFGAALRTIIGRVWARKDGLAAIEWISRAPSGQETLVAIKAIIRSWSTSDLAGLHRWMDTRGPAGIEAWFERAVPTAASTLLAQRPEDALAWVQAITDTELRERSLVNLTHAWRRRDAESAEAWIAAAELSPALRARTLAPLGSAAAEVEPEATDALDADLRDRESGLSPDEE